MKRCDIIIPVWNELESTNKCIDHIISHTTYPFRLVIIDNGSQEPSICYLKKVKRELPETILIRNNDNLGFVKAVNQGIMMSDAPYICILNNDAYVTARWLTEMIAIIENKSTDIGLINPTSNVFVMDSCDGKQGEWQELDSCKGFCMLIKREIIDKVGMFDEVYGMGYFEEQDFSRRAMKAGYICARAKSSYVYHKDKLSFDKLGNRSEKFRRNEEIYTRKWGRKINVAFINGQNSIENKKDILYALLKKGHYLFIFHRKTEPLPVLKDHIRIKYFALENVFFACNVLFRLWKRRSKKKIEVIVTDKGFLSSFLSGAGFIHGADIVIGKGNDVVNICEVKSKERCNYGA